MPRPERDLSPATAISASGDSNAVGIARLKAAWAAIGGYGIGTCLVTGTILSGVYRLVEIDGIATMKQSSRKATNSGRRQIFRRSEGDCLGLATETPQPGDHPLLGLLMPGGLHLQAPESTDAMRARQSSESPPGRLRCTEGLEAQPWPVKRLPELLQWTRTTTACLTAAATRGESAL